MYRFACCQKIHRVVAFILVMLPSCFASSSAALRPVPAQQKAQKVEFARRWTRIQSVNGLRAWRLNDGPLTLLTQSEAKQVFSLSNANQTQISRYRSQLNIAQAESFRLQGITHYSILSDSLSKNTRTRQYIRNSKIQYRDLRGRPFVVQQFQFDKVDRVVTVSLIQRTSDPKSVDSIGSYVFQLASAGSL